MENTSDLCFVIVHNFLVQSGFSIVESNEKKSLVEIWKKSAKSLHAIYSDGSIDIDVKLCLIGNNFFSYLEKGKKSPRRKTNLNIVSVVNQDAYLEKLIKSLMKSLKSQLDILLKEKPTEGTSVNVDIIDNSIDETLIVDTINMITPEEQDKIAPIITTPNIKIEEAVDTFCQT
ncbi:hypothetical protein I4U23_010680 [Adineta vaga]|nr:hypothetical protein I4U23_010680 [Adineta vaga]